MHEDLMALHLNIIKDDAHLLRQESQLISDAQNTEQNYNIQDYIDQLENIVGQKQLLYHELQTKIQDMRKQMALA